MIHVLTVHWQDDRWIDIQLKYLNQHIGEPFHTYAFLNGVPEHHRRKFFYSSTEPVDQHSVKLNLLADVASFNSRGPQDMLIFIDGDAFPIATVAPFAKERLKRYPLIAVQRLENAGDFQPHPSFCITTVGFWKEIQGDWKPGYKWFNQERRYVTDVGGNLLQLLENKGIEWYPMRRSNKRNIHPLLFGIYDDMVYHHGAAYRTPLTRIDRAAAGRNRYLIYRLMAKLLPAEGRLNQLKEAVNPTRKSIEANRKLIEEVYSLIKKDPFFYEYFQGKSAARQEFKKAIR